MKTAVNPDLQAARVLLVLLALVRHLFDSSLVFADSLHGLGSFLLLRLQLGLQLSDPSLESLQLLTAALRGQLLGFVQSVLQVFDGLLHVLLHALQVSAGVLLLFQLLRHHGRISDSLLGFFLSVSCFLNSIFYLSLDLDKV